jgi:hypothetical protein
MTEKSLLGIPHIARVRETLVGRKPAKQFAAQSKGRQYLHKDVIAASTFPATTNYTRRVIIVPISAYMGLAYNLPYWVK